MSGISPDVLVIGAALTLICSVLVMCRLYWARVRELREARMMGGVAMSYANQQMTTNWHSQPPGSRQAEWINSATGAQTIPAASTLRTSSDDRY